MRTTTRTRTASSSRTSTYDDALVSGRPRDLLRLHGPRARGGARQPRHVHAEAVHAPDRQRLPLPHVAVARRREPVPRRRRPARARAVASSPTSSSAGSSSTRAVLGIERADRQLVQAASRLDGERRHVVAGLGLVRQQQPHPDDPHPRSRPYQEPHDRRLGQPVSRRRRPARRRPRRGRERTRPGRAELARTCTRSPTTS